MTVPIQMISIYALAVDKLMSFYRNNLILIAFDRMPPWISYARAIVLAPNVFHASELKFMIVIGNGGRLSCSWSVYGCFHDTAFYCSFSMSWQSTNSSTWNTTSARYWAEGEFGGGHERNSWNHVVFFFILSSVCRTMANVNDTEKKKHNMNKSLATDYSDSCMEVVCVVDF